MNYSITNEDIEKVFGDKCKCLLYKDLKGLINLDSWIEETPFTFVLYNYTPSYGHWTCLFKCPGGVEFFDSYGVKPDEMILDLPKKIVNNYGYEYPEILRLLKTSKRKKFYNQYELQNPKKKDIKTCGRWCILRCLFNKDTIEEFAEPFLEDKDQTPDELVTELTELILGK